MSDSEFWGRALLAGLTIWFALSIITAALWAIVAHRPDPWERYFAGDEWPITADPDTLCGQIAAALAPELIGEVETALGKAS